MRLPQVAWDPLPYERFAARFVGGTFAIMFCAGLLLSRPWLPQLMTWLVLLPGSVWLTWTTVRFQPNGSDRTAWFSVIVAALSCYLAVLLVSTSLAGNEGRHGFAKHAWDAAQCIIAVAIFAQAIRKDCGFSRYLGRWIAIAVSISSLMLLAAALASGALGHGRLEGVPAFNWVLNANAVGGIYAICFAVAVGHGLRSDISARERGATFAFALLPLAIVLFTQSRGAMLGCLAALVVALVALPRRLSLIFCVAVAVTAASIAIADPEGLQRLFSRGDSSRLALWQHFIELSRDHIWLGRGLNFDVTFRIGSETIYTPHNIFVAALVRGGLVGLAALIVAVVGAVLATITAARQDWWLPATVLASSLALSSVDHEFIASPFSFYWYLFWLPFGLAAAASLAPRGGDPALLDGTG